MKNLKHKKDRKSKSRISIPFGPAHPGSAHFHAEIIAEGEDVIEVDPDPGYLHRGFEKLMEYRTHIQNCMLVDRVCVLDPFSNEMGYSNVVEALGEIEVPERAKFIRTIMAELGRILSHITWIGVISLALGFGSANKIAFGDREKILRLIEIASGGRIYPTYFCPGGVRRDLSEGFKEKARENLDYLEKKLSFYDSFVFKNSTFKARTKGVGTFNQKKAITLGTTGPNLRASGVESDVRKDEPYAAYSKVDFNVVTKERGDAYARSLCRREEISESISIVRQALDKLPEGKFRNKKTPPNLTTPEGDAYFCCESARGELCFYMVSDGGDKPYRVKIRGPSFAHTLSEFPYLCKETKYADVPAIYWSLDPCPADMDR